MNIENRLRKDIEFKRVYKYGKNYWNRYLTIYIFKNNLENSRIGFTITKKIGNAVTRNKLRRRMKEICRLNLNNIEKGYDIIIIPKKRTIYLDYKELERQMLNLFTRSKIYKGE